MAVSQLPLKTGGDIFYRLNPR